MSCDIKFYMRNLADVARLKKNFTLLERGILEELLDEYAETCAPIPIDFDECKRIGKVKRSHEVKALREVLKRAFDMTEHGYVNKMMERAIAAFLKKSLNGQANAHSRWGNEDQASIAKDSLKEINETLKVKKIGGKR